MVQKKASCFSQGDKTSAVVQQFASGFVAASRETEEQKEAARAARAKVSLLAVDDDDAQVQIYNAYSRNSNTSAEGGSSRKGLGCGAEGGGASGASWRARAPMTFVAAGGAPAATPAAGAAAIYAPRPAAPALPPAAAPSLSDTPPPASASTSTATPTSTATATATAATPSFSAALPPGWVVLFDAASGWPYYSHAPSGRVQWEAPPPAAYQPPPHPPTPAAHPALPEGWQAALDPSSGYTYYCNASLGLTQWQPPALAPPASAPPPRAAGSAQWASASTAEASVQVHGIPPDLDDVALRELFGSCGQVVSVQLDRGNYSAGSHPKSAVVRFDVPASADLAVKQVHGTRMRSHQLTVKKLTDTAAYSARPY
ncbi:hypothetical protein AB1Y20_010373 [Prymnesium parvum]|uniref:Polyglutamine tract-binding protein 1 n=1 Tax=Prymnesium parvum TaxID=97485 RepID=A0AB34IPM1_PRYPA